METVWQRRRESRGSRASHGMGGHRGLASGSVWVRAPGQAEGAGMPGSYCLLWERELTRV